jgi:hypothetical protein
MQRSVHIAVALLAVFLLVRPFDCFASGKFDRKAAECCQKGKCSPSTADDCCRATIPGGQQVVKAQECVHSTPVVCITLPELPSVAVQLSASIVFVELYQPPGSPPDLRLNLPLLI